MKKISSVLLAFLMLVSSLFCANAAFGEDWSSQSGKNTFQSAENLVIGTIYNRPATEITGTVFRNDKSIVSDSHSTYDIRKCWNS